MTKLKTSLEELQKTAKERTVKTMPIQYDLETLVKKIDKKLIMLNPDYQRNHRWTDKYSSRLIESLILNIPIPIVYISQDIDVDEEVDDGISRYSVIDGQQRLTAIYNFFKNKYCLTGLEILSDLNNCTYADLPPFLTRRLEERTISCLRIDSVADPKVKYDIFERLNTGSVELTAQELRNASFRGSFNSLIKKLAKNKAFTSLACISPDSARTKKMEDVELVLRFFALTHEERYKQYKGGMKGFLDLAMEEFNLIDANTLQRMEDEFTSTMEAIANFSNQPFSKYRALKNNKLTKMSNFNAAVFDAVVCFFSTYKTTARSYDDFKALFADSKFFESIEGSVTDAKKLHHRINTAHELLR